MAKEPEENEQLLNAIDALRQRIASLEKKTAGVDREGSSTGNALQNTDTPTDTQENPTAGAQEILLDRMTSSEDKQTSRALLNTTADSVLLIDKNGRILDANTNLALSLGKPLESLIGTIIYDHLPPEVASRRREKEQEAAQKKKLIRFEDLREGRWRENSIYPVFDNRGELIQYAIFSHDITKYKKTEKALLESEERFRLLINNIPSVSWTTDDIGNTTFISPNVRHVYGFSEQEIYLGGEAAWFGRIHPEDISRVRQAYSSLFKNNTSFDMEYRIQHKAGHWIWLHDQAMMIKDKDGRQFACGVFSDITDRIQIQKDMQERERYYRTLFESASEAIFIMEQYDFIECNQKVLNMFGCTREQILGKNPADFSPAYQPDGQDSSEKARRILEDIYKGIPCFFEWQHQRLNGELFDAEVNLAPLKIKDQNRCIASVRDITERKKAEETLSNALAEVRRMKEKTEAENIYLYKEIQMAHIHGDIVGQSESIKKVLSLAEQVAETDATVLILGETGTGKELLARAIHNMSPRRDRPLVTVNCAAIPATLVESELFGREKGAFTGAIARQIGRFEIANRSTIFLDEIGELSLDIQAKLLRVIQEGQIERLGSAQTINVDVRIITATNRNLEKEIEAHKFREDLFYRLNVFPISIPPLRDRKEDIPTLVWNFVDQMCEKMGKRIEKIPQQSIDALQNHDWPGNVRELHNVIERAMIQANSNVLRIPPLSRMTGGTSKISTLAEAERNHILEVLKKTGWRIRGRDGAADILDIKPTTLESRMLKLNIKRPTKTHDTS